MKISGHVIGLILIAQIVIDVSSVAIASEEFCTRGQTVRTGSVEDRAIGQNGRLVWLVEQKATQCGLEGCNEGTTTSYFIELAGRREDGTAVRFPFSEPQILDTVRGPGNQIRHRYRYDLHLEAKLRRGGFLSFWKTFAEAVPVYHRGLIRPEDEKRGDPVRIGQRKKKLIDDYSFLVDEGPSQPIKRMTFNFWRIKPDDHVRFSVNAELTQACVHF